MPFSNDQNLDVCQQSHKCSEHTRVRELVPRDRKRCFPPGASPGDLSNRWISLQLKQGNYCIGVNSSPNVTEATVPNFHTLR
jgi:hypothetical protein